MKKHLEIMLEGLKGFDKPVLSLEQYVTPPALAAHIVSHARLMGDLGYVLDLGCGTGMLSIASALAGAEVLGVDIDMYALKIALENSEKMKVRVDFVRADVLRFECKKRDFTTIMNPPFGIQRKYADRPFLEKAMELSEVIYTIHSAGSESFIERLAERRSFFITHRWFFSIPLKRTYEFHEKEFKYIPVEVYRIEKLGNSGDDVK